MKSENVGLPFPINTVSRAQMKRNEEDLKEETRNSGKDDKIAENMLEDDLILSELRVEDENVTELLKLTRSGKKVRALYKSLGVFIPNRDSMVQIHNSMPP
ncbi:hypothetical protein CEXT_738871 [Caerostris extrusa]|uniref:Uncharacterized protein n=1 Tax=Caerostris extrusa TaxID=172846 RepID=A0AAV4PGB8_CAEEX|nr:hypothetical protein CEXT_738871 [Caerostris extrusa]